MHFARPHIVVGIDIGQTCSGVAYSLGPAEWTEPRNIQRWPSSRGDEQKDKVATRVSYNRGSGQLQGWGELAVFGDESVEVREFFKLTLDPEWQDYREYTCSQATDWYCDYLRCLHQQIEAYFDQHVSRWREKRVEFNFSTPTTWRNPAMVAGIEKMIKSSGFSSEFQSVRMSLTEAEAAAIEASTCQYKEGDVFMICDAGGGTTDVNVLRVKSKGQRIELEALDNVEGISIGSTLIDTIMGQHILERLELVEDRLEEDILQVVENMLQDVFQTVKHNFPKPMTDHFKLPIRALAGRQTHEEAGIYNSEMRIERYVLKDIFDLQISKIFELMDERLTVLQMQDPNLRVSYMILSGGFGSSPYLYEEMKRRYERNFGYSADITENVRIQKLPDPQLAVVRGLVRERTQQLGDESKLPQEVFKVRKCRNSYGVVVRVPYDEYRHKGLPMVKHHANGKPFLNDAIDWLIKQGDEIDIYTGIRRDYGQDMNDGERLVERNVRIVMSTLPKDKLPALATQDGCKELVRVKYRLTENDMRVKHRWKFGPTYHKASFSFVVRIEPASLRFQVLGRDGQISADHENLEVDFLDPPASDASAFPNVVAPTREASSNGETTLGMTNGVEEKISVDQREYDGHQSVPATYVNGSSSSGQDDDKRQLQKQKSRLKLHVPKFRHGKSR